MGLFDFIKKIPTVNELKGSFGEWLSKIFSKTIPGALVLHDVLIDGADGNTSQIDLIIIGGKGIYVVEVKMFTDAKIYGDCQKSKWYYYKFGKKYEIYSPIKQNKKHVEYLKTFLRDFGDIPFFSVVTMFCDDFKLSGNTDENTAICNSLYAMERALYKLSDKKPVVLDPEQKQRILEYIKANQYSGKDARTDHKQQVIAYKESLEEMSNKKICPYCKTDLVLREGKNGKFYGCKNFPKCRYTTKY
ncbi:MAG: NERD domain-containing protein [Clostridia bacterium]|nr:NERD domain-containing protein [Clostridia bacterium]